MDRYCVFGHPVGHSLSPRIHARFAELTGQALEYGRREPPLDGFAAAVHAFRAEGGRGCNVTVPFKFEAALLAGRRSERAELAGACNTLMFEGTEIRGDNTDGIGLVNDLQHNAGVPLADRDILLLGAGGAAAGVLGPLLQARPRRVVVGNRTGANAAALVLRHAAIAAANDVQVRASGLDEVSGSFDVVINGTASSMTGDAVPVGPQVLKPGALALDMMYGAAAQGFLDWARAHGASGRDGLGMLVEQAAESFRLWRGVRPPAQQVLAELRRELAS